MLATSSHHNCLYSYIEKSFHTTTCPWVQYASPTPRGQVRDSISRSTYCHPVMLGITSEFCLKHCTDRFQDSILKTDQYCHQCEKLQELPESQRADAVSSMVYEANARIRDPVYGCAGAISQLQKQVSDLQAQLAKAQAEVVSMQCQQANLVALLCMEMTQSQQEPILQQHQYVDTSCFLDENNLGTSWEPLWT